MYIDEAIGSVLAQSNTNFEIVIVDDGSTDNTFEVLSKYSAHPQINCVYQQNKGPGAARNAGMRHSKGKYICFLDADDILEPESLCSRHQVLAANENVAMVFTDYTLRHTENDHVRRYLQHSNFLEYFKSALAPSPQNYSLFNNRFSDLFFSFSPHPIWTGTVMLKKSVIESVGLFRTDISVGEDTDYWMRIAAQHEIAYIDQPTAVYNHCRSHLTKNTEKCCRDRITRLKKLPISAHIRKSTIQKNISDAYFQLGYHYHKNNKRRVAAVCYLYGLLYNYKNTKCIKSLFVNLLPSCVIKNIKIIMSASMR
jgi:glycosyltransferase involved in cell wall biosynthesis